MDLQNQPAQDSLVRSYQKEKSNESSDEINFEDI